MLADIETMTGWKAQTPQTPPAVMDAFLRLVGAVVERAIRDAATDTPDGYQARAWLLSEDAALYLENLGIHRDAVVQWLQNGAVLPARKG